MTLSDAILTDESDDDNDSEMYLPESDDNSDSQNSLNTVAQSSKRSDKSLRKNGETILDLPPQLEALKTPIEFFKYFFTDEMLDILKDKIGAHAKQKWPEKSFDVTTDELEQFLGVYLNMCLIRLPSIRAYWSEALGHPRVNNVMSCNRWEEIKRYLHFNDNAKMVPKGKPDDDPLYKIRPFLYQLRARLLTVPKQEDLSTHDLIISTKLGAVKKSKRDCKIQLFSGSSGFVYDFEINLRNPKSELKHDCGKCIADKLSGATDMLENVNVYNQIQVKPKKIHQRVFFRLIDMMIVNAWLLYRRNSNENRPCLTLTSFKMAVADALCWVNKGNARSRQQYSDKRDNLSEIGVSDIRLDKMDHLPCWADSRNRCKLLDCNGRTFVTCSKCQVHLCLNLKRNCFLIFHTH